MFFNTCPGVAVKLLTISFFTVAAEDGTVEKPSCCPVDCQVICFGLCVPFCGIGGKILAAKHHRLGLTAPYQYSHETLLSHVALGVAQRSRCDLLANL
jgi:hypothetical protein